MRRHPAPSKFLNRAGNPIRGPQDPAKIAWNLATGLCYTSQASPPWKIANMRDGVCHIGLVFKLIPNRKDNHACCAARMFLSEGDGVVFRGANGPWQTEDKEFHLSKDAAKRLVDAVLQTCRTRFGENPRELFIHGTTKFGDEEKETPNPIHITVLLSTGPAPEIVGVLGDIMGPTKINYSAANFSDSLPVTIRFANKVGEVLVMGSAKGEERQLFKFHIWRL